MNEERMRILQMIQEGRLSAEEGARLLEALGNSEEPRTHTSSRQDSSHSGNNLKILIFDSSTGREKLNLNIPIGVAKMFGSFIPDAQRDQLESHGIRFHDLLRAVESGEVGTIVDIQNPDRNERVEISIE